MSKRIAKKLKKVGFKRVNKGLKHKYWGLGIGDEVFTYNECTGNIYNEDESESNFDKYGLKFKEIISQIKDHTGVDLTEVSLSKLIETNRKEAHRANDRVTMAFRDLDKLSNSIKEVKQAIEGLVAKEDEPLNEVVLNEVVLNESHAALDSEFAKGLLKEEEPDQIEKEVIFNVGDPVFLNKNKAWKGSARDWAEGNEVFTIHSFLNETCVLLLKEGEMVLKDGAETDAIFHVNALKHALKHAPKEKELEFGSPMEVLKEHDGLKVGQKVILINALEGGDLEVIDVHSNFYIINNSKRDYLKQL
jgi:hypothetical protein